MAKKSNGQLCQAITLSPDCLFHADSSLTAPEHLSTLQKPYAWCGEHVRSHGYPWPCGPELSKFVGMELEQFMQPQFIDTHISINLLKIIIFWQWALKEFYYFSFINSIFLSLWIIMIYFSILRSTKMSYFSHWGEHWILVKTGHMMQW